MKVTRRIGRLSGFIAMGVAIAGTGWGVMSASYSTFSAQTANPTNTWTSGSLTLADDDANTAMFAATPTAASGSKCIKVNSTGSYQGVVKLYSTGLVNNDGLAEHINLKIEIGAASGLGGFGSCTGFAAVAGSPVFDGKLKAFDTASNSYANGAGTGWTTAQSAADYRVFKFTWSYDDGAPQNATATDVFTWDAQTS